MKLAQECSVELPSNLTFRNSMNKKISLSEDEAKKIKDAVEKIPIKPIEIKIALIAELKQVMEYKSPIFNEEQINKVLKIAGYGGSEAELNLQPYLENLSSDDSEDDNEQQDISNEPSMGCIGASYDFSYDELT